MWNPFKKDAQPDAQDVQPDGALGAAQVAVPTVVHAPCAGQVFALQQVPDPVFSKKVLGDGFAVEPTEGTFRAPVDGELVLVAETGHAFAVRTDAGAEVLVHIGIDTVKLKGAGFRTLAKAGDRVQTGDPVVEADLEVVRAAVPSMATCVLLTNGREFVIERGGEAVATITAR